MEPQKNSKFFLENPTFRTLGSLALLVVLAGFILIHKGYLQVTVSLKENTKQNPTQNLVKDYSEISEISGKNLTFTQLEKYFQDLANKKGARYAFEILKRFQPGANIDMHLLGHAVGDILYKQEGLNGITDCTNDFRNACSHSIVIGLFYDKGDGALPEISEACRKAPGGSGAYTMCFHGLGHGILAYEGFDMAKAAAMCQKTGTEQYHFQEATQCLGGTVMEIVDGGGHDHEIWAKQRPKYLDPKQPAALCENSFFPPQSKFMCYEYLTPYFFEAAGANLGSPGEPDFKKAFTFCANVPIANRNNCYSGFGKEFVGIVQSRDIRLAALAKISDDKLKQVYNWCMLANDKNGSTACIMDAMNNLYWGGENDNSIALRFCAQVSDGYNRNSCYQGLIQAVGYYIKDVNYKQQFCGKMPEEFKTDCEGRLGI